MCKHTLVNQYGHNARCLDYNYPFLCGSRDSIQRVSSDDRDQEPVLLQEERYPPAIPARTSTASREVPAAYQPQPMQVIFPTRLHLNELEVDFLRVNELTAGALTMDRLETPHLQVRLAIPVNRNYV